MALLNLVPRLTNQNLGSSWGKKNKAFRWKLFYICGFLGFSQGNVMKSKYKYCKKGLYYS